MNLNVLGVLLFFSGASLALVALQDFVLERHRVYKSLRGVRAIELTAADVRRHELARPFGQRVLIPALRRVGSLGRRMTPASVAERLTKELVYAGSPAAWDAERVLAMKLIAAGALGAGALLLSRPAHLAPARALILALLLTVVGYYLPEWILRGKSASRQKEIQRHLPDALDLLSITVEAGLGFDAAVARVARQSGGALGEEMHRVLQEMQIGKSRADALRDLGERSTVPELKSFVLAMVQADVFGIAIGGVLRIQASEMRMKRRQRAEERAQRIPVKIVFPLIFCIFPSLFIVVLGPAALSIYKAFTRH